MKVLLVSALPPPEGGIAIWTTRYLNYCKQNNISVSLVNIALNGNRGSKINNKTNITDEYYRTKRILKDMNRMLNKYKPSVVHINTSCGPIGIFRDLLCVNAAYKKRIPIVLHFHCNIQNQIKYGIQLWALQKMSAKADILLVLNNSSKQFVNQFTKIPSLIVPNFIEPSFLITKRHIRKEIKEIVFVGHVQTTKGSKEILDATKQLPDIHFSLVGPIADEIKALYCPDNVSLIGPKSPGEVRHYLLDADLFLFPSYTEGFSLSLTEAMATGLPAIATNVGANKDMIEKYGGIIIPVKDSTAIINAIKKLHSPVVRKKMSEWSINKVKEKYLVANVMKQLIKIYEDLEN